MVFSENEFDKLLSTHDQIKFFKTYSSLPILENYHSKLYPKFKLKIEEKEAISGSIRQNLSVSAVCSAALSQYFGIWDKIPRKDYAKRFKIDEKNIELYQYYIYIIDELESWLKGRVKVNDLELLDEFSLLNTLSLLKYFRSYYGDKINLYLKDSHISTINKYISLLNNKYFRTITVDGAEKLQLKNEKRHPFFYYKFLCIVHEWRPKEEFNKIFDILYEFGKRELYRQMSLYRANDMTQFDIKRLIYGLLIVTTEDRYSNITIKQEAINIIFKEQYTKTGMFSMGQSVKPIFVIENGTTSKGDRIISGNPILTSIECLNDMLLHEYIGMEMEKYTANLDLAYSWISNSLRKDDMTGKLLGWFPEHADEHVPKSWVAGHYLIYIKNYCDLLSSLIQKQANFELNVMLYSNNDAKSWSELGESYNNKKFIDYMIRWKDGKWVSNPKYASALLYGPPGTGKSTIARSLAKRFNWNYVEISPGMFLSEGESNIIPNINAIFKRLMRMKNAIIFFDEVDQLVENRTKSTASSRWIVTSLLPKFQALRDKDDVKFIMATNNVAMVDPAIMRGGRIDFVIPMGALSWKSRLKMLRNMLSDKPENAKKISTILNTKFARLEDSGDIDDLFIDYRLRSDKEIDELTAGMIKSQFIKRYLSRTNYILLPDLISLLKTFDKKNWDERPLYDIFFSDDPTSQYLGYENDSYKKFHKNKPMNKIKLPPEIKPLVDIESIFNENIFR